MNIKESFTEIQIGLLEEALNIGAGNAVTALSQLLQRDTDMSFPVVKGFLTPLKTETLMSFIGTKISVEMNIVGELQGGLVFVISETDEIELAALIRGATEEQRAEDVPNISLVVEIANILAGVFLTAIHDFCGLNVFHTVPVVEQGTSETLQDIVRNSENDLSEFALMVSNEFTVNRSNMATKLLVILSSINADKLIHAIEAREIR